MSTTIDLTPSWETAAMIYCQVLENPEATVVAKEDARADLIRLGQFVDRLQGAMIQRENEDDSQGTE